MSGEYTSVNMQFSGILYWSQMTVFFSSQNITRGTEARVRYRTSPLELIRNSQRLMHGRIYINASLHN